uniref:Myosin-8-like n=1 Tax=Nicotiana tabacum TaxID=4097 RepID=A0A1S3XB91_TOBAC|nr:PREDICTED: myosin-8-like [Nicotiana tabacum]
MDRSQKRSVIITVPEDTRASVLHHEAFLRYRAEVNQLEAEVKELAEKRGMYKLLSEQREKEVKNLQAELDASQKEHADLVEHVKIFKVRNDKLDMATNGQNSQVQQKVDKIDQLQAEMDEVKAMAEEGEEKMDRLASKKETAQEQLASVEVQLRVVREKSEARAQKIEDFQSQLGSTMSRPNLRERDRCSTKIIRPSKPVQYLLPELTRE